jgi:hypothetical protein
LLKQILAKRPGNGHFKQFDPERLSLLMKVEFDKRKGRNDMLPQSRTRLTHVTMALNLIRQLTAHLSGYSYDKQKYFVHLTLTFWVSPATGQIVWFLWHRAALQLLGME